MPLCLRLFSLFCMGCTVFILQEAGLVFAAEVKEEERPTRPPQDYRGIISIVFENDIFAGEDDGYTNGFRVSWLSSEVVPRWLDRAASWVPVFADHGYTTYGFSFGQTMFAPRDLRRSDLIIDDRPYAGFLFVSADLLRDTGTRMDHLQFMLGVVGPASGAERTQDFVHDAIGSIDPQGWDHQLENEPGLVVTYERKWRALHEFGESQWAIEAMPHVGFSLGNVHTHLNTGVTLRFGYDLPADYGPPLLRPNLPGSDFFIPTNGLGWYVFAGVEGRAVAQNIFLDGNSFEDSHSVDKKHLVGGVQLGVAMTWRGVRLAYTHVLRSREFHGQDEGDEFGALTLSFRF